MRVTGPRSLSGKVACLRHRHCYGAHHHRSMGTLVVRWTLVFERTFLRLFGRLPFERRTEKLDLPSLLVDSILDLADDVVEFGKQTLAMHERLFQGD